MANDQQKPNIFQAVSLGLELGFLIAVPLALFLFLGVYSDKKINTFPVFTIIAVILSFAVMILELKFLILPFMEKRSHNNKSTKN